MNESFDLEKFSEDLLKIRMLHGLTRQQVAIKAKISTSTLFKLEKGKQIPRYETLESLSKVYNTNLLKMLNTYKSKNIFSEIYDRFDHLLSRCEFEKLNIELADLYSKVQNINYDFCLDPIERKQLLAFINCLLKSNTLHQEIKDLISIIRYRIPNFNIRSSSDFKFTELELRILFCLSSNFLSVKLYDEALQLLKVIFNHISHFYIKSVLYTRVLALLSCCYHVYDQNLKVIEYCDLGIQYCIENSIMDNLNLLYLRKGIALIKINAKSGEKYLVKSIFVLIAQDNSVLAKTYLESVKHMFSKKTYHTLHILIHNM